MGKLFRKIQDTITGFKTANLINRFEFDGGSWEGISSNVATDLSDNATDGVMVGSFSYGNGYVSLQGSTTEYIRTADLNPMMSPTNVGDNLSVFLWVYPTSNGIILCEQGTTTPDSLWFDAQIQRDSSDKYLFSMWPYSIMGTEQIMSVNTYPLNEWHYVGYTYDGTNLRGYVNGNLEGTYAVERQSPYNFGNYDMHLYVGYPTSTNMVTAPGGVGQGPKGTFRLGAMHVYNVGLTTAEVLANYNAQKENYTEVPQTGLILHVDDSSYPGTGTTWGDLSGNSNSLTLVNTPTFNSYGTNSGGYFTLNGTNQHFTAPSGFADFTSGITVISIADLGAASNWERIIDFGQGQGDDNFLLAREATNNTLTFEIYNGNTIALSVDLTSGITNENWGFYGFKANGSTYTLFNGTASTTGSSTALPQNVTRNLNYVGRSNWAADAYTERYIGALLIYNRALSDAEIDQVYDYYSSRYFDAPTNGLVIELDANDVASYSGSGTSVNNLVSGSYTHTLTDSTFTILNGVKCFDCTNANSTIALTQGTGPTLPTTGYTYITWARLQASNSGWRTLLRSWSSDHPILVQIGTDNLGFYDNQNDEFYDSGYDVTTIKERWVQFTVVGDATTSTFYINDDEVGTVAYGAGGNTHWAWGGIAGQGFGHVANLYLYERKLSAREIRQTYNQLYPRFIRKSKPVSTNLVLHLDPKRLTSYPETGTTIYDLSGNSLDGTLSNLTFTSPALVFNGSTSQISVNDNSLLEPGSGNWTMEAWFKLANVTGSKVILGKFDTGGGPQDVSYSIRVSGPNLFAQIGNGLGGVLNTHYANSGNYTVAAGTWYQALYVYSNSGDTLKTYINGELVASVSCTIGNLLNTTTNLYIGSYNNGEFSQFFNGSIGIVRLYGTALTDIQVAQNFDANRTTYGL